MSQFHVFSERLENTISNAAKSKLLQECASHYYARGNLTTSRVCYTVSGSNYIDYERTSKPIAGSDFDEAYPAPRTSGEYTYGNILNNLLLASYDGYAATNFYQDITDLNWNNSNYSNAYNSLITTHGNIIATRSDLDRKMDSLYNSKKDDTSLELQNSVYTTLFWTVLATSLLYFLFIHL
jgi:hypothetical protein